MLLTTHSKIIDIIKVGFFWLKQKLFVWNKELKMGKQYICIISLIVSYSTELWNYFTSNFIPAGQISHMTYFNVTHTIPMVNKCYLQLIPKS
jgi:hypothetical protein